MSGPRRAGRPAGGPHGGPRDPSAAGVGEGARTGFAHLVTGGLFAPDLFLTPLLTVVPLQAAAPAPVAVGFLMTTQVRHIAWDRYAIAVPAFLTTTVMPFTYSITNGIGAGFLAHGVVKTVLGRAREVHWLLWGTSALCVVYFAIDPVEQLPGVKQPPRNAGRAAPGGRGAARSCRRSPGPGG
ncbi:hypothetical protein SUDANB70_04871 [Streptomyces sp. enrichment culture]